MRDIVYVAVFRDTDFNIGFQSMVSSVVEHQTVNLTVTGSTPVPTRANESLSIDAARRKPSLKVMGGKFVSQLTLLSAMRKLRLLRRHGNGETGSANEALKCFRVDGKGEINGWQRFGICLV